MKFAEFPVRFAAGVILAHSLRVGSYSLKKGTVLNEGHIIELKSLNIITVTGVRLEPGDLDENDAAVRIAEASAGSHTTISNARTGRCNILAEARGISVIDADAIDNLNLVDETVTLATILPYTPVDIGDIVATAKIITFGASNKSIVACENTSRNGPPPVNVAPFKVKRIGLIQSSFPKFRKQIFDKATTVTRSRVQSLGSEFVKDIRTQHTVDDISNALNALQELNCDIALALGASAIADRQDVIPAAIEKCGGSIIHFGIPVDPGNLMMLARVGNMQVLGLPGSARSPRLHGFDWVLNRMACDIPVNSNDLMRMGVGGLLKEIPGRPMPRARIGITEKPPKTIPEDNNISVVVLAAGQSRRMGALNKLLAEIEGKPMLAHGVDAALASSASQVIVVTGHEADKIQKALASRKVKFVHNPEFADGLSSSLRTGLTQISSDAEGVLICLGDMPGITANHLNRLIGSFSPDTGQAICVPIFNGKRGNPVLWHRRFITQITDVSGDVGARHLIGANEDMLVEVSMDDNAVLADLDTPEALAAHKAFLKAQSNS